jgi:hypothetical protein
MKYIITILVVFFTAYTGVLAQPGTGRIYGVVKDASANIFLESATIIVYKTDSSVLAFKITDKNGNYDISGIPLKGKYFLTASFTGYKDYRVPFTMDIAAKKMDSIFLQTKTSDEVIVTSVAPIRMKGDTLEINPAAFKMTNDAVTEDLLNKVPGVVVWADGSITMNGKAIPKVLVDGKPFLGSGDHRLATQNLPKNIIDRIQVYTEVDMSSETNRTRMTDSQAPKDSVLTMDIKLKADKKNGRFGKYGFGIGTDGRYQTDAALQFYNKRSSFAIGGGANNINADIAGLNDLQRENTFRNNYSTFRSRSNFGRSGINRVIAPGIQFAHSFTKTDNDQTSNRITGGYDYNNNSGKSLSQTYQERYLRDGDQLINSFNENNSQSEQHAVRMNYGKSLDYNKRFSINASGRNGSSNSQNTSGSVINTRQGIPVSDRKGISQIVTDTKSFDAGFNYMNFDNDNPLKALDFNGTFSRSQNNSDRNESSLYNFYTATGTNTTNINRHYTKSTGSTNINGTLSYNGLKRLLLGRFNLFGVDISTFQNFSYRKDDDINSVFDIDSSKKENTNTNLTYTESASVLQYMPSLSLNKNFSKWSSRMWKNFSLRSTLRRQFIKDENASSRINRNISRSFAFTTVGVNANYSMQVTNAYRIFASLNYENGNGYPSINQIAPVVDSLNLYILYKGGHNLVNNSSDNINWNINYSTNNPKKPTQITAAVNGSFNAYLKPFVDSTVFLRDTINIAGKDSAYLNGRQVRYTINGNRRNTSYIGYSTTLSRKIKGNQWQLQYNGGFSLGQSPSYIDDIYTVINSANITQMLRLNYYYKTILIAGIGSNASFNNSRQTGYKNSNFKTSTISGEFNLTVNFSKDLSLANNFSYSKNNGIIKPISIWNANATYRFLKSRQAELKFTATDILKQYRNISYFANPDGVTTSVNNGLQQYFMIGLSYFPRKFGSGGERRQGVGRRL